MILPVSHLQPPLEEIFASTSNMWTLPYVPWVSFTDEPLYVFMNVGNRDITERPHKNYPKNLLPQTFPLNAWKLEIWI